MTSISTLPGVAQVGFQKRFAALCYFCELLTCRLLEICGRRPEYLQMSMQNYTKLYQKWWPNPSKIIQNQSKWCQGTLQNRSWKQVRQNCDRQYQPEPPFWYFFASLWRHLGDFGRNFGHHWAPRGPKIEHFGARMLQKVQKKVPERVPEKHDFLMGSLTENVRFLKALSPPKCFIYKHFGGFRQL